MVVVGGLLVYFFSNSQCWSVSQLFSGFVGIWTVGTKKGFRCAFVCIGGFPEVVFKTINCKLQKVAFFPFVMSVVLVCLYAGLWAHECYHCTL